MPGAYASGRRAYLQNSQWRIHSSHCCPGAAGKGVTLVPRDRVRNQPMQGASPAVHPQQQSSRTSNASSLLQQRSHSRHEQSQIPRDPLRQNANVQDEGRINKTQVQERTVCVKSHGFKRHRTTSSAPAVSKCDAQSHWLWSGSHKPVAVWPAQARQGTNEAMTVILGASKDTPIETRHYLLDLPAMETRHKVEQVNAYLSAMQNLKNPLHDAVKEDKGCRLARGKSWVGQAEQSIQHM